MTTQAKLTDTKTTILKAAAGRPDGSIEPLPANLRGGARTAVINGLLARGLIAESDGGHQLNDACYAAVGKRRPAPKGVHKMDAPDALTRSEPIPCTIRSGTKLATIIDAMRNPDGATIAQMMANTGWQAQRSGHDLRHGQEAPRLRGDHREGGGRAAGLSHRLTANHPRVCAHRRPLSSAKSHGGRFAIFRP